MSPVSLSPCPSCRAHRLPRGPCPHCGDLGEHPARTLMKLGLKVTAATAVATTLACVGGPLDPTPVAVYGAPPPIPFPPEPLSDTESLIEDGWSYIEVHSGDEGPQPETDGETE